MVGSFACPECGLELKLEGLSPGRQIQCEECLTWVEVPFLPRASGWRRGRRPRRRSAWESNVLRAAVVFAVVALLGLAGARMIGGRVRSGHELVLAELVASADTAEACGRYDVAFREIAGAVVLARKVDPRGSERLDELIRRRDRVSVHEARARLAAVDALDPDRAVRESLELVDRARIDRALAPMADAIGVKLSESRRRQADADLATARRAFEHGRSSEAFDAADRLHTRSNRLPEPEARRFRDEALALLEALVARDGVVIAPVVGRFVAGSPDAYSTMMDRLWSEALRLRGYLPRPRESPWRSLWDEKALARATTHLVETQEELYLQSKNRTTQVDGTFELTLPGRSPWSNRVVVRTRVPLPNLPAYLAGHLATAGRRNPEAERRLHDDAQDLFVELSARALRGIPAHSP
jgi:hypothetical protein